MSVSQELPSILDARPVDGAAVAARNGFSYQDTVAAGHVLEMLAEVEPQLIEVHCETEDDITLMFDRGGHLELQFIQVKSGELPHLWSYSIVTKREARATGSSVLERSLLRDRYREPATFRMVTARQVNLELACLRPQLDTEERLRKASQIAELAKRARDDLNDVTADSGKDPGHWIELVRWDETAKAAVIDRNLVLLNRALANLNQTFLPDQVEVIHESLCRLVATAACATVFDEKRVTKPTAQGWLRVTSEATQDSEGGLTSLRRKMNDAGLSSEDVATAISLRADYLRDLRERGYRTETEPSKLASTVKAELMSLRHAWAGETGREFHVACLARMKELVVDAPEWMVLGAMYDITSRCFHKFSLGDS